MITILRMKELDELLAVADKLLSKDGCPWDREQTLFTLQPYLLEETHELIDAIDKNSAKDMSEELGDVLYALIFIARLAEQKQLFTFSQAIKEVKEKLIRRHPHVFGNLSVHSMDEISQNWEVIKKSEGKNRKSLFEGIPPTLPAVARCQKVIQKLHKAKRLEKKADKTSEEEVGQQLFDLICLAESSGIDAESALRRVTRQVEEKENTGD